MTNLSRLSDDSPFDLSASSNKGKDIVIDDDDLSISAANDHALRSKKNYKVGTTGKISVIDLEVDDYADNYRIKYDNGNIFVKEEKFLMREGNVKEEPICIEDTDQMNFNEIPEFGKHDFAIDIDTSVKCVDHYDDSDEIRIIDVKPFPISSKKRRNPFSGPSITEAGECSRSKNNGIHYEIKSEKIDKNLCFVCEICTDSKLQEESFWIKGCTHWYCTDCVRTYIVTKLLEGVSEISCLFPGCLGTLDPEHCKEILPFEIYVRWGNLMCVAAIVDAQKFYCPFKDCSCLLIDDGNEMVTRSECPSCNRLFCAQCKVVWHEGIGCVEYQGLGDGERQKEDIMLMNLAKGKGWRRCPKCKFFVEKISGCSSIICRCSYI
ncbi:unnamed protein product [Amaranthus hypochondriacus]